MPKPLPVLLPGETPYAAHRRKWKDCTRCELHSTRSRVVFARGKIPADVVFLGEGPGKSEDALGSPFKGPAGIILDQMLTVAKGDKPYRVAYYNLLGCMPPKEFKPNLSKEDRDLPVESVEACMDRVHEFLAIAKPKLVIALGKEAAQYTASLYGNTIKLPRGCYRYCMDHPARVLHEPFAGRGLLMNKMVLRMKEAFERYLDGPPPLDVTDNGFARHRPEPVNGDEDDIPF